MSNNSYSITDKEKVSPIQLKTYVNSETQSQNKTIDIIEAEL